MSRYHYSASQISTFRDCKRKWFFGTCMKMRGPKNPYAELGTFIHSRLEEYLQTGKMPKGKEIAITITKKGGQQIAYTFDDIAAIMLPGIKHLPAPGVAETELKFEMDLGELGTIIGFIDYTHDQEKPPVVGDHKTTSALKWALTKEELAEDVQATIYGVYACERYDVDEITARWGYFQTKKPRAKKVEAELGLTDLAKNWQSILTDIREMKAIRDSGCTFKEVDYDATVCEKYGGCPFISTCGLTPAERMRSFTKMLSLRERMEQRKKEADKTPAVSEEQAATEQGQADQAEQPAVNPPEGMSALEKLRATKGKTKVPDIPKDPQGDAPPPVEAKPAPAPAKKKQTKKAAPAAKPAGFTLYIDCSPNHPCATFTDVCGPVLDKIKTEHGTHYKLIEGLYGGNGAFFAEELENHFSANGLPTQDMMVSLSSPMVRDVIEVLINKATTVVRGF